MAKRIRRHIEALITDTHGGFKFGLMPIGLELIDEYSEVWHPQPTSWQRVLWDQLERCVDNIKHLAGRDPVRVLHLGDPTHGNHFPDKELVSTRAYDHFIIAVENARPLLELPTIKSYMMVEGTGVHEFQQGTATYTVRDLLKKDYPKVDVQAHPHVLMKSGGLRWDMAHHGPSPGIREWTKGNVLRLYTQSLMKNGLKNGEIPPDVLLRGHFHEYTYEIVTERARGRTWHTHSMIVPAFTALDNYARKVTRSKHKTAFGMVAIEVINGRIHKVYDEEPDFIQTVDLRQEVDFDAGR